MTVRSPAGEDPAVAGIGGHNDVCALLMNEVFLRFRREGEGIIFQRPHGQKKAAVSQGAEIFAGGMVGIRRASRGQAAGMVQSLESADGRRRQD